MCNFILILLQLFSIFGEKIEHVFEFDYPTQKDNIHTIFFVYIFLVDFCSSFVKTWFLEITTVAENSIENGIKMKIHEMKRDFPIKVKIPDIFAYDFLSEETFSHTNAIDGKLLNYRK